MARKGLSGSKSPEPSPYLRAKELGCEICTRAKFTRHSRPSSPNAPVRPLSKLHTDVHFVSNASVTSDIGFVSFLEDNTAFAPTTLIKRKAEVGFAITDAVTFFETQYAAQGYMIKCIFSDNIGEYKTHHVAEFCVRKGMVLEFLSREIPQQNGNILSDIPGVLWSGSP